MLDGLEGLTPLIDGSFAWSAAIRANASTDICREGDRRVADLLINWQHGGSVARFARRRS